jgi:hypothetical protein
VQGSIRQGRDTKARQQKAREMQHSIYFLNIQIQKKIDETLETYV